MRDYRKKPVIIQAHQYYGKTRPRRADEKIENHILRESSNFGVAQSTVTFIEH